MSHDEEDLSFDHHSRQQLRMARWKNRYHMSSEDDVSSEVQVLDIPAEGTARDEFLLGITNLTGFPIDFSKRAIECAGNGFLSVRTSAESIPRFFCGRGRGR